MSRQGERASCPASGDRLGMLPAQRIEDLIAELVGGAGPGRGPAFDSRPWLHPAAGRGVGLGGRAAARQRGDIGVHVRATVADQSPEADEGDAAAVSAILLQGRAGAADELRDFAIRKQLVEQFDNLLNGSAWSGAPQEMAARECPI